MSDAVAHLRRGCTLQPPGADLSLAEWESPAGERHWIAPLHIHHEDDEIWYVLAGRMILQLDGIDHELGPGDAGMAVRGVTHSYRNAGPGSLRYLIVMPDRVRRLVAAIHGASPGGERPEILFARHASTYLGWPPGPEGNGVG